MPTRYSPVGDENESRQRCDDETFSDIETSSTIDEKDPQQSKPRDWKHLRHLAITTVVLAILLTVILVFGVAFRSKSTERKGPVPNCKSTLDLDDRHLLMVVSPSTDRGYHIRKLFGLQRCSNHRE